MVILGGLGFWMMVTGQSLVLYSRLNLIVGEPIKIRWAGFMIAVTFFLLMVPTTTFLIASTAMTSLTAEQQPSLFRAFSILENVQTAALTLQETILASLYIREARRSLQPMRLIKGRAVCLLLRQLTAMCVLTVCLDATLMGLQYSGRFFDLQTMWKGVAYGVKLQVEALVLSHLTRLVRSQPCTCCVENYSTHPTRAKELELNTTGSQLSAIYQGHPLPTFTNTQPQETVVCV